MSSRKGQWQLWQIADGAATESSSNRERVVRNSNWQEFGIYNRGFRDYRSEIKLEATWYPLLRQGIPFSDMVSPSQTGYPLPTVFLPWYPLPRPGILLSWWFSVETGIPKFWRGYPKVGGDTQGYLFLCHICHMSTDLGWYRGKTSLIPCYILYFTTDICIYGHDLKE